MGTRLASKPLSWKRILVYSFGLSFFCLCGAVVILGYLLTDKWHQVEFAHMPYEGWLKLGLLVFCLGFISVFLTLALWKFLDRMVDSPHL